MTSQDQISKALNYLRKDIMRNCELITMIELYPDTIEFFYVGNDGVSFIEKKTKMSKMSTDNKEVAEKILPLINLQTGCTCKTRWDMEVLKTKYNFKTVDECKQFIFEKDKNFVIDSKHIIKFEKNNEKHMEFLNSHYRRHTDKKEYNELVEKFNFYAYVTDDGEIAGCVGRHNNGEIGYLEVDKRFRRRGIGTLLIKTIVNEDSQLFPFSEVYAWNKECILLHEKMGAKKYNGSCFWCY